LNVVAVCALCFAAACVRAGDQVPIAALCLLAALHAKRLVEEVVQCLQRSWSLGFGAYFFQVETAVDWAFLLTGAAGIAMLAASPDAAIAEPKLKACTALMCAQSWLRLLYSLRSLRAVGPRLLPIFRAVRDTGVFCLVMLCSLAAATHAYYVIGVRDKPEHLYAALMQVVRLGIFADFDLIEFEGLDTQYVQEGDKMSAWVPEDPEPSADYFAVHTLFYVIGIGIAVVLMNLYIGVLSQNQDLYQEMSTSLFLRSRAMMIMNFHARPWRGLMRTALGCWGGSCFAICCGGVASSKPLFGAAAAAAAAVKRSRPRWLWVIKREKPSVDQMRSLRSAFNAALEEKVARVLQEQAQRSTALEDKVDTVAAALQDQAQAISKLTQLVKGAQKERRRRGGKDS